jgi:hypothetical protein
VFMRILHRSGRTRFSSRFRGSTSLSRSLVEGQPSRQRELLENLGHSPLHQSIQCALDEQIMKEI